MKLPNVAFRILLVCSIFLVNSYGSSIEDENSISSTDDGHASSQLRKYDSRIWQESQWWINSPFHPVSRDDGEDFRDKWPKLELNWRLVVGSLIGFAGSALGSAGGIGGGGYYLAMLNLFIGFDAKTSTALSKSMVMGAAIASAIFNVRENHPKDDKLPVIDYSMAVLFQPFLLLGISIGVILNVLFPEWLISVLFCLIIGEISWNSLKKANKLSRQETLLLKAQEADLSGDYVAVPAADTGRAAMKEPTTPKKKKKLMIVWSKVGILSVTWVIFCSLQVSKMYVPTCSPRYWILDFLQIPTALGVTLYAAVDQTRKRSDSDESEEEPSLKEENGIGKYMRSALYGLGGGFIGGLLGVGGGAIMGPAFLHLGLPPEVASSTSSFAMIFSSSLSVVEYWLLGRLPAAFAVYCISLAMVASFFGQFVIKKLVRSTGKPSYIVYCLAYSVLATGVLLAGLGAVRIYNTWVSGGYMGFHSVCVEA